MSDIKIIYILLKFLQIFSMFALSVWVAKSKNDKVYWKRSIWLILIWALVDGLRFARDQDYNSYYPRFELMASGNNPDEYEYLFYLICRLFGLLSLPYWTFIFVGSTILIITCLWLFKDYRKYLPFIIILMFWDLGQYDNLIRFYWAFPFFALSIYYRIKDKTLLSFILIFCAVNIHSSYWIVVPVIVFYGILNKEVFSPKICVIIYLAVLLLGSLDSLSFIAKYANYLDILGVDKISNYADQADMIVSGNFGYNAGNERDRGLSTIIRLVLAYAPSILWGKDSIKKYNGGIFIYNIFIIGAITMPLFQLVEILDRLNSLFLFFSCIVTGNWIGTVLHNRQKLKFKILLVCWLCLISSVWPSFSSLFHRSKDQYMLFLWDANGRQYIPTNIYPMFD